MTELDVSVKNSPCFGGNDPVYGAGISIELPLFDGSPGAKNFALLSRNCAAPR
jgi:hypothetical protein